MNANAWDRSGARWPVGPGGARDHELGAKVTEATTAENTHGGRGLLTVVARAVDALKRTARARMEP